MLRPMLLALFVLASCTTAPVQGSGDFFGAGAHWRTPESDRAAVEAVEHRWLANLTNPAALETILAEDFQHPVASGDVLTKEQHIQWAAAHPTPDGVALRFETLRVRVFGDTALASGIVARTASTSTTQRTIFTDVFAYRAGRWLAINAQETPIVAQP